ncbi:hypothetical protein SAMN05444746_10196 [Variovorax sp. OK212]|nr:hypothetical protein SAMN05518853_10196 [Variovorax sp. OK202]SFB84570.1 hypothetical protein SAMN05444746_10196 [Variovorax sp. OK212]
MSVRARRLLAFLKENGASATVRLLRTKLGAAVAGRPVLNKIKAGSLIAGVAGPPGTVSEVVRFQFPSLQPLATYLIPRPSLPRISLITDSIGSGSLFGGVGTALLFAAQLANRMNATLRIVTRTETPSPKNVLQILSAYGIQLRHEIQFAFAPVPGNDDGAGPTDGATSGLDIGPDETFVTTSWWTTAAALSSVPRTSIVYLLQEDERMFYPFGEERVQCEQVLRSEDIRFVVNTRLLFDHLVDNGLEQLKRNGLWFEPAFPKSLFQPRQNESGGKKRFFFYARPNNPRNLFHIGLDIIDQAINKGILDLAQWDVFLVGKDIPKVIFGDGYLPTQCEGLNWEAYADLAGTIDLGLCLMCTPHPSYPPLDLAASGAVVVTNKFGNKQDLSSYSQNIICADLDTEALLDALREGVALAQDGGARSRNFAANGLSGDWAQSFETTLQSLVAGR